MITLDITAEVKSRLLWSLLIEGLSSDVLKIIQQLRTLLFRVVFWSLIQCKKISNHEMRKMCLKSTYKCENPSNCNLHISMSSLTNSLFCHCHRLNLFMSSTEGEVIFAKMQLRRLMTLFHTFFYLKQEMLHGFMVEFKVTNSIPDFYKF